MTHPSNSSNAPSPNVSAVLGSISNSPPELKPSIPAWAASFLLHLLIFLGLILALTQYRNGAGQTENRSGGIVLVDATSETTEYLSEGDVQQSSSPDSASASPPPPVAENELPPDIPGLESAPTKIRGAGDQLAEELPGADSLIDGPPTTGEIGGKVTTAIFGVKGTGSRFVYVVDRSESMAGFQYRPMLAARQQLIASLESLKKNNQFQIVFYNQETRIFNPDGQPTMYFATDEMKREANEFVQRTKPVGGTDHLNALKRAFKLGPDVIFLLTDAEGGFTKTQLREIGRMNRSAAIINAIEFGESRGRDRSLEAVAVNTGGQYVFKNTNTLRLDGN